MKNELDFICPGCHGNLHLLACSKCNKTYFKEGNVILFENSKDEFYEGKFAENKDAISFLPDFIPETVKKIIWLFFVKFSLILRYQKFFIKYLKTIRKKNDADIKILDLACGGGNSFLKEFGEVHGLDISRQSINVAKNYYDYCYVADIYNLPFVDKSFDVIASFELIEHIPEDKFNIFLNEIKRVLKDDGISLHYFVVDSQCRLGKFIKRYPDLFNKYFVEKDGHHGLRKASDIKKIFDEHFNVLEFKTIFARFLMPLGMVKYFDNEYKDKNAIIRFFVSACKLIISNIYLHSLFSILFAPVYLISDYFKKEDEGFNVLVSLKK